MRRSFGRQRGTSMTAILFGVVMGALLLTLAGKLAPHYLEFHTVKSAMDDLKQDAALAQQGNRALLDKLGNNLYINDVSDVQPKDFSFKSVPHGFTLGVEYEVRQHLFANIDAVLTFSHETHIAEQ